MTWVYVILVIFVGSTAETTTDCLLYKTPKPPQLSTTFMKGYWYQHLFVNNLLQNETCAQFEITCNATRSNCIIYNYKLIGYELNHIWNGTVFAKNEDWREGLVLVIYKDGENSSYDVNLKFNNNALLIWSCNDSNIVFASTLYRMEVADEMMNVWEQASIDMSFPDIIENTPTRIWKKIDPTECLNGSIIQASSWTYILLALGTIILIGNS